MPSRSFLGAAFRCFAVLASVLIASSCAQSGGRLALDAEPGLETRLGELVEATPPPEGWSLVPRNDADVVVSLGAEPGTRAPNASGPLSARMAFDGGRRWLASPLGLADPRFDLSRADAESLGLDALESIVPPLRAATIAGLWPGQEGYPFFESLVIGLRSRRGKIPAALATWGRALERSASEAERPLVLGATGDIQIGAERWSLLQSGEKGLEALFGGGLLALLRSRDLLVGNLEAPISARGEANPRKRFHFRLPPGSGRSLGSAGFDLLLFANHHAFDYGLEAFSDTLDDLRGAALPYAGAGSDQAAAAAPVVLQTASVLPRLAFIGFANFPLERLGFGLEEAAAGPTKAGINADEEITVDAIKIAVASGDTVIVLAHGGHEYLASPPPATMRRYRDFADAGAALVIGSHPHVLQGIEARGSSLIAYSLGNFLFTDEPEPPIATRSGLVSFLLYKGCVRGLTMDPILVGMVGSSLVGDGAPFTPGDRARAQADFTALFAGLAP